MSSNIDKSLYGDNDDWLSKELKRESRISAWDIDDNAKSVREEHEDNCDAENVRSEHNIIHLRSEQKREEMLKNAQEQIKSTMANQKRATKLISTIFVILFCMIFISAIMTIISSSAGFRGSFIFEFITGTLFSIIPIFMIAIFIIAFLSSIKKRG